MKYYLMVIQYLEADTIVNNGNYNTGLITFTIDEVEYQAYNGRHGKSMWIVI